MAEVDGGEADGKAQHGVEGGLDEAACGESGIALVGECREGGEAAAKADGQEKPPMLGDVADAVKQSIEQTNQKTADDVGCEGAPDGRLTAQGSHKSAHAVARHTAQEAAHTDKHQNLHRLFNFITNLANSSDTANSATP